MTSVDTDSRRTGSNGTTSDAVDRALLLLAKQCQVDDPVTMGRRLRHWVDLQPDQDAALGWLLRQTGPQLTVLSREVQAGSEMAPSAPPPRPPAVVSGSGDRSWLRTVGLPKPVRPVTDPPEVGVRRQRQARIASWVRNCGFIVLLFLAFQWWGTAFQQHRAQAHFRAELATSAAAPRPGAPPLPLPKGAVARLQIPSIDLDQFVVEGTSVADLEKGPGHYVGTAMPGEPGNAAIAGHRTTYGAPFNQLDRLVPGDTVIATTDAGQFLYVVSGKMTVSPNRSSVVADYGDNRLTLTTCTPEFLATRRLIVVAKLEGPVPAGVPARVGSPPPPSGTSRGPNAVVTSSLRQEAGAGFDWSALLPVSLAIILLVGLGLVWRPARLRLPPLAAAVVLVPVWSGALLILFEQLSRLLPPNV